MTDHSEPTLRCTPNAALRVFDSYVEHANEAIERSLCKNVDSIEESDEFTFDGDPVFEYTCRYKYDHYRQIRITLPQDRNCLLIEMRGWHAFSKCDPDGFKQAGALTELAPGFLYQLVNWLCFDRHEPPASDAFVIEPS
jgi:hypothetical protein